MLLLASSVCGLFKWRQFEPEVILLAVGWYLRFSLYGGTPLSLSKTMTIHARRKDRARTVVPRRGGVTRRAGRARRSRHGVAMGPAVCAGNGTTFALKTQFN